MKMRGTDFDKCETVGALEAQWRPDPGLPAVPVTLQFAAPADPARGSSKGWIITGLVAAGAIWAALPG